MSPSVYHEIVNKGKKGDNEDRFMDALKPHVCNAQTS